MVRPQPADVLLAQHLQLVEPGEHYRSLHIPSIPSSHSLACNLADMQIILSISSSPHTPQPPTLQISHAVLLKWRAVTQAACHTTYCFSSVTLEIALTSQLRARERERVPYLCLAAFILGIIRTTLAAFRINNINSMSIQMHMSGGKTMMFVNLFLF